MILIALELFFIWQWHLDRILSFSSY